MDAQATGEDFSPQKRTSNTSKHENSVLFSIFVVFFALLDSDPDPQFELLDPDPNPATHINADPDTDPDPQPCPGQNRMVKNNNHTLLSPFTGTQ
jgi:hypothetical protein